MKRLPYIIMTLFFSVLYVVFANISPNRILIFFIVILQMCIMTFACAQRLRNIGWMPGYAWIYLVPLLNIPLIYYCFHLPMNYVIDGEIDKAGKIIRTSFLILFISPVILFLAALIVGIGQS